MLGAESINIIICNSCNGVWSRFLVTNHIEAFVVYANDAYVIYIHFNFCVF